MRLMLTKMVSFESQRNKGFSPNIQPSQQGIETRVILTSKKKYFSFIPLIPQKIGKFSSEIKMGPYSAP